MPSIQPLHHAAEAVAQAIHVVLLQAHRQEAWRLGLDETRWPPLSAAEIRCSGDVFIGAWDGAALLGAVGFGADDEPGQCCLRLLVVRPQAQRRGVGRRLVRAALEHSPDQVFAVSVAALNTPALSLYQDLGFAPYRQGRLQPQGVAMLKLRRAPGRPGG